MKMERFLQCVLIMVMFLLNVKFADSVFVTRHDAASEDFDTFPEEQSKAEATGEWNISPDALYAIFAVGGAAVIVTVAIMCFCICRIHLKRTVDQEKENLMEKGEMSPRNPLTTSKDQGNSCKLFIQKEADGRFKKKKRKRGKRVKYLRMSRDPKKPEEWTPLILNRTLNVSNNWNGEGVVEKSFSSCITSKDERKAGIHTRRQESFARNKDRKKKLSAGRDLFENHYETLKSIGEGTFGIVKSAIRKTDFKQVAVKFILKAKVSSWTRDRRYGCIPREVGILRKLEHPNIVKVIDVFEDEEFVQMVMERHGSGMDLVDFYDRKHRLGEPLASFIFRQVLDAVAYLHSINIVHRDIKGENIIIDESFCAKLIDFGAAAYFKKGSEKFSTFCGTYEFCSPEVLLGNTYNGPEQDMWALGVTLYELRFGENPFASRQQIIQGSWNLPFVVTSSLRLLLTSLLEKDPKNRGTILDCKNSYWINQPINIADYKWCDVVPP